MSRRFGRNQRRRAREEAAFLNAELERFHKAFELEKGISSILSHKVGVLQEEIDRAKDLLPEGSILFEPGEFRFDGPSDAPIRMPVVGHIESRPRD